MLTLGAALGMAALLALGPSQAADDTVINFDDFPHGTAVSNQYHDRGVDFRPGLQSAFPLIVAGGPRAISSPNVIDIGQGANENRVFACRADFTSSHHCRISVWADVSSTGVVRLSAFDSGGNIVRQTSVAFGALGGRQQLQVECFDPANPNFAGFEVVGQINQGVYLDNLTFDTVTEAPRPDFSFSFTGERLRLRRGGPAVTATVGVNRHDGSTGNIDLSAAGLPPGVEVTSITPNPATNADGENVSVMVRARGDAFPASVSGFRLVGTPSPAAGGYGARDIVVPISILDSYDAHIVGIEVTQGIQPFALPRKSDPLTAGPVAYAGVGLAVGKRTTVRVFASIRTPPSVEALPPFECELYGVSILPFPENPLRPERDAQVLHSTADFVEDEARADPNRSFIFTLPTNWTRFPLLLVAKLVPRSLLGDNLADTHPANNEFILERIPFTLMRPLDVVGIRMTVDGQPLQPFEEIFADTREMLPLPADPLVFKIARWGSIDITEIWNDPDLSSNERQEEALDLLRDTADDFRDVDPFSLVLGIFPAMVPGSSGGPIRAGAIQSHLLAIVPDQFRPRTAVAHEVSHLLGRPHASMANGGGANGQRAEPWPPDEQGYLQGVGFDWRGRQVLFSWEMPDRPAGRSPLWDFMSYAVGASDMQAWISTRGWNNTFERLRFTAPFTAVPQQRFALNWDTATLLVQARVRRSGETVISRVSPGFGRGREEQPDSPYRLVVRNARGRILASAGMTTAEETADGPGPLTLLDAKVALAEGVSARAAHSVEILHNGVVVASRVRSPNGPRVSGLRAVPEDQEPEPGKRTIQWTALDRDGDPIKVKLDYTPDGGCTWYRVYFGPNRGELVVPVEQLPHSVCGQLRLLANDGFNETEVLSRPFSAEGAPPVVRILSPEPGDEFNRGASVYLSGVAYSDRLHPVPDCDLAWYADDRFLGTGPTISVADLAPGQRTIRFEARDYACRLGSASVEVTIRE